MSNKYILTCMVLVLGFITLTRAQQPAPEQRPLFQLKQEVTAPAAQKDSWFDLDNPRTKSLVYSFFVPGSGQVYLGEQLKGTLITLGFFGSAITMVTAQNNMLAREDRIKALTGDYLSSSTYAQAEKTYKEILVEKDNRQNDYRRRNLFTVITTAVWIYNIVDVYMMGDNVKNIDFSYAPDAATGENAFFMTYKIALR